MVKRIADMYEKFWVLLAFAVFGTVYAYILSHGKDKK